MKKFNKSKVIIPALAMIALTTAASATGTVAWFSANQAAAVTGMTFKTAVSSNLLVAGTTDGSTAIAYNTTAIANEAQFKESHTFGLAAKTLIPASTTDGIAFWTTSKATADGAAIDNGNGTGATYVSATNVEDNPSTTTVDETKTYYVDYSFELKAVAVDAGSLNLTTLNLLYNSSTYNFATKAWRVAVFVDTPTSGVFSDSTYTLKGIYTPEFAKNQKTGEAVSGAKATSSVSYVSSAVSLASLTAKSTNYYRVTARIWLEGEDKTCTNAMFLSLTDAWSLNMKFEIGTSPAGVINIGSAAA